MQMLKVPAVQSLQLLFIMTEVTSCQIFKTVRNITEIREVSFFIGRGPLEIFQVLWIFSVPPCCMSEIFLIPPEVLQNLSDPPPTS